MYVIVENTQISAEADTQITILISHKAQMACTDLMYAEG